MNARKPVFLQCRQRSDEWYAARLGIPTASCFNKLVTSEGKPRKGATPERYISELVYERLFEPMGGGVETWAMRRGTELEPHARAWYELATGLTAEPGGFVFGDDSRMWGCSPDGLIDGGKGGVEIKCPLGAGFAAAVTGELDEDYYLQAQGEMWVCGAEWWDIVIYTEEQKFPYGVIRRVYPDEDVWAGFEAVIPAAAQTALERWRTASELLKKHSGIDLKAVAARLGPEWLDFNPDGNVEINMEGATQI